MLLLSCSPCADSDELVTGNAISLTAQQDKNSHEHEKEDCSPFCTCSCCGRSVICHFNAAMPGANIVLQTQRHSFSYTQPVVSLNTGNIFQPPREPMI